MMKKLTIDELTEQIKLVDQEYKNASDLKRCHMIAYKIFLLYGDKNEI